jgi:ribosomal protein L11 methylase PrmA
LVENDLFWAGYAGNWERVSLALWRDLARDARCVLDVGANSGVFALAAAAVSPKSLPEKLLSDISML